MCGAVAKHVTAGERTRGGHSLNRFSLLLLLRGNKLLFLQRLLCDIINAMHRCTVVDIAASPVGKMLLC